MLADIKVKLSHYGEQTFTGSLYETLQLKKKQSSNIEISH